MTADQAKAVAEVIGQGLQGEWMHTYKAINAVPDAKKDFKPETNSRSAWDLAQHIAICDVGFLHAVAANSFSVFPAKCGATTIPELADWYKHEMAKRSRRCWRSTEILVSDSGSVRHDAVGNYLMSNNHMIISRSADNYPPMGGKVPAMYGESFDEKFSG